MKRKSIGNKHSMCVQPAFIVGTYNEDGKANFAPITWISVTCEGDEYLLVVSMYGTKQTKTNVMRTGDLSVNLVSVDMLPLMDYFGTKHKHENQNAPEFSCTKSDFVNAPVLDESRWVYECKVCKTVKTGLSDTFFCRIKNIQIDETIPAGDTFEINLEDFNPVIYSGQYHSIGKNLGKIGDFWNGNAHKSIKN